MCWQNKLFNVDFRLVLFSLLCEFVDEAQSFKNFREYTTLHFLKLRPKIKISSFTDFTLLTLLYSFIKIKFECHNKGTNPSDLRLFHLPKKIFQFYHFRVFGLIERNINLIISFIMSISALLQLGKRMLSNLENRRSSFLIELGVIMISYWKFDG